jgi:hypothetical protein
MFGCNRDTPDARRPEPEPERERRKPKGKALLFDDVVKRSTEEMIRDYKAEESDNKARGLPPPRDQFDAYTMSDEDLARTFVADSSLRAPNFRNAYDRAVGISNSPKPYSPEIRDIMEDMVEDELDTEHDEAIDAVERTYEAMRGRISGGGQDRTIDELERSADKDRLFGRAKLFSDVIK